MIANSLNASKRALSHVPLTLAAIAVHALLGLFIGLQTLDQWDNLKSLAIPITIGMLAVYYLMARRAGFPREDEVGSAGRWFGWGFASALPMILFVLIYGYAVGYEQWSNSIVPHWTETAGFILSLIVALPLSALSTGRAINGEGISASVVFAYSAKAAGPIVIAGLALLTVPNFLSDGFLNTFEVGGGDQTRAAVFGIAAGLALLAGQILTIGISAAIYRAAEQTISV